MNNESRGKIRTELFADRESAERAYDEAIAEGYKPEEINVMMSDESRQKYYDSDLVNKEETGNKSMEGLGVGSAVGGVIGGTLGAIAAIGTSILFPGLGLIIAGPLAAGLAGAGAGSISGGLVGALIGWGIPEEKAKSYEKGIKSGGIVLGVDERPERASLGSKWDKYRSRSDL
ncbi:MAG: hypothetical protein H0U57_01170 [Tatlockia sp.]|nr:hypothetical protein [Tatlockia sp.]